MQQHFEWWNCRLWVTILDEGKHMGKLLNKSDCDCLELY